MLRPILQQTAALRTFSISPRLAKTAHAFAPIQRRLESSSAQQPTASSTRPPAAAEAADRKPPNTNVYKQFGRPFAKVFLGAMFVYQLLYWSWEKMRLDEVKEDRRAEIKDLEQKVEEYKMKKAGT